MTTPNSHTALYPRSPGRPLGRDTLADFCECSVRTVQRDVDLLRSSGVPIDYDAAVCPTGVGMNRQGTRRPRRRPRLPHGRGEESPFSIRGREAL